jgi:hypothetical protein
MEKSKFERVYQDIEYEFEGKVHRGRFYVERGWLTLLTDLGHKGAALNRSPPGVLARILFGEIIAAEARSGAH